METRRALSTANGRFVTRTRANLLKTRTRSTYQMLVRNGETQASLERRFCCVRNVAARALKMKSHTRRVGAYTQKNYLLMLL